MSSRIERQEVSLQEALSLTKYSRNTLQKLVSDGHITRKQRATFELGPLFQGVMEHLRAEKKNTPKSAAQERLIAARAKEIEMRNKLREGEVMLSKDVMDYFTEIFGMLKVHVQSMPAMVLNLDPAYRNNGDMRRRAQEIADDVCSKISAGFQRRYDEAMAEQMGTAPPQPATADEEDE